MDNRAPGNGRINKPNVMILLKCSCVQRPENERDREVGGGGSNEMVRVSVFGASFCTLDSIPVFVCKFGQCACCLLVPSVC